MRIMITGASGLVGKELCNYLSKKHDILAVDKYNADIICDLTKKDEVDDLLKFECRALINCFALNPQPNKSNFTVKNFPLWLFEDYMKTNLTSLFYICQQWSVNNLIGSIINFSSLYGMVSPRQSFYEQGEKDIGYSVSKAGVIMLTKHLATHLAPDIRVNCIVPGGIYNNQDDKFVLKYKEQVPLKRMMNNGELNSVVDLLLNNSYMTGSVVVVDGGYTSW